jgi:hypothetical protein
VSVHSPWNPVAGWQLRHLGDTFGAPASRRTAEQSSGDRRVIARQFVALNVNRRPCTVPQETARFCKAVNHAIITPQ